VKNAIDEELSVILIAGMLGEFHRENFRVQVKRFAAGIDQRAGQARPLLRRPATADLWGKNGGGHGRIDPGVPNAALAKVADRDIDEVRGRLHDLGVEPARASS
jgi:hypothetical protein